MIKNDEFNYIGIGCHVPARYIWDRVSRADTICMGSGVTSRHDIYGIGCHEPTRYVWDRVSRADTIYWDRVPRSGTVILKENIIK